MNSVAFAAQSTSGAHLARRLRVAQGLLHQPAREAAALLEVRVRWGLGVDAFYVQDRVQRGQARFAFAQLGEAHYVAQRRQAGVLGELGEDLAGSSVALGDHRQQQRFLRTEVVQDAGRGEIDLLRDLRQRAAAVAALGEDFEGGVDDRLAALRALLRLALQLLHAQSLTTDGILNKRSGYSGGRDWQGGPVQTTEGLTLEQRAHYDEIGFIVLRGFAQRDVCDRMLERVVEIARLQASGARDVPGLLLPEANLRGRAGEPEELVSKIFKLHRDSVFAEFAASRDVTDLSSI